MSGSLIAIGGALDVNGAVMQEFYQLSGGADARIIILPTASALAESGEAEQRALLALGVRQPPVILPIRTRTQALESEHVRAVQSATGIYFTGGNQMRLTVALTGTPLLDALRALHRAGAVVSGSSAGAAALTEVMIAYGRSGQAPRHRSAQITPGLGFDGQVIFDQHFNQRNRLGRLLYIVAANPGLLGVGVDENTAAILQGPVIRAAGAGGVTIVDGAELSDTNVAELEKNQLVSYANIRIHLLTAGSSFDISRKITTLEKALLPVH